MNTCTGEITAKGMYTSEIIGCTVIEYSSDFKATQELVTF